jgi:hypothetical protein
MAVRREKQPRFEKFWGEQEQRYTVADRMSIDVMLR